MGVCPSCKREIANPGTFCPYCGARLAPDLDATAPDSRAPSSSSSSSVHGRFEPGTRLGTRYRVVGLLGRGGMGEVYRADDLELGQTVALKFLPDRVARSASDLARLRQEVRVARQIAHPNVCRIYDLAEADGQAFVVMEYVDGEDLASVLRRLGRPSPDKALEIARQLCLGLGAAHENGILHRDLKPANIMIDGRGRVRVTDFGLAGTAEEIAARGAVEGTPGYMAPEQAKSGAASVQSDIYSLGLVLYEIFTGKRASEIAGGMEADSDSGVRTPSSVVSGIEPAVERIILQCLNRNPARRPHSAYAVFGALPGGDPLAAAVAAGETPSPALVASAGTEGSMSPRWALLLVVLVLAGFYAKSLVDRSKLADLRRSTTFLSTRAEEIVARAMGAPPPRYSDDGYRLAPSAATQGSASPTPKPPQASPPKQYWKRWSPTPLVNSNIHALSAAPLDPVQAYPGSATIVLSPDGVLRAFSLVPTPIQARAPAPSVDWSDVVRAAGHDPSTLAPAAPPDTVAVMADSVAAWRVPAVAGTGDTLLVTASLRGRPILFDTYVGNASLGELSIRAPAPDSSLVWWWFVVFAIAPITIGIVLARRNFKTGRVDVRGGLVLGILTLIAFLLAHALYTNIAEVGLVYLGIQFGAGAMLGHALIHAATLFLAYVAMEPYLRRLYPRLLVSWARLTSGRLRDPIIGRDILLGAAIGTVMYWLTNGADAAVRAVVPGTHLGSVLPIVIEGLGPPSVTLARVLMTLMTWVNRLTLVLTLLVAARFLLRKNFFAVALVIALVVLVNVDWDARPLWYGLLWFTILNAIFWSFTIRFGFLACVIAATFLSAIDEFAWSTDPAAWYMPSSFLLWGLLLAALAYGFWTATRGRIQFHDPTGNP